LLRRLFGALAGLIVGGASGAVVGAALAHAPAEPPELRLSAAVIVGAFVGCALGGRRWLIVLGCAPAGYFLGREVGQRGLVLEAVGVPLELSAETVAVLGFSAIGAIVGIVLAVERRESAGAGKGSVETKLATVPNPFAHESEDGDAGKTVRRKHL